ncbi:hypothetical protein AcV7_005990 [Taiwanofungus camphoratus]|nr:hypothetical protein AcV7_005990 [Antrodia cinnamomea]
MSAPSCSPPPYSLTPPDPNPAAPVPRAASSPHLRAPPSEHFSSSSSTPSSSSLAPCPIPAPQPQRGRASLSEPPLRIRADTSDEDPDAETPPSDDSILYTTSTLSFSGTLRSRLLGKRKGRAHEDTNVRPITTAPGVVGAGETETESEDSPRNLPTARITNPALAPLTFRPWLVTFLFSFSRLLSIVPAVLGTIWNVYHIVFPPGGPAALDWRVQFFVSTLWAVYPHWLAVPPVDNRPAQALAGVLFPICHAHPPLRAASDLLACDAHHSLGARPCETPRTVLGRHRHDDVL